MFPKHNLGVQRVEMRWAVEREPSCQKILSSTYGTCVFGDIMDLGKTKTMLYCHTHKKYCPLHVPNVKGRFSADQMSELGQRYNTDLIMGYIFRSNRTILLDELVCKPWLMIWFTMLHQGTRVNLTGLGYAKNMLPSQNLR